MLGILGGGQLGRFFVSAARHQGYLVGVLDPDPLSPAGQLANRHWQAGYTDPQALAEMANQCTVVTTEFENVPADVMAMLANQTFVAPNAKAVSVTQDRIQEKTFIQSLGLPVAPCYPVVAEENILSVPADVFPAILKVSRFGYDGKGQATVSNKDELLKAWKAFGEVPCILEKRLALDTEISVVFARGRDNEFVYFPIGENHHRNGILDVTIVPARVSDVLKEEAVAAAKKIAEAFDYIGVGAVEMFVSNNRLYINEIAPRTHNSGHYTLDACDRSQFDMQVRALCGLPLPMPKLLSEAVMVNILGDQWQNGSDPDWAVLLNEPSAHLWLYGKQAPKTGRKMGHFTILELLPAALEIANKCRRALGIGDKDVA